VQERQYRMTHRAMHRGAGDRPRAHGISQQRLADLAAEENPSRHHDADADARAGRRYKGGRGRSAI
jgi:hypothetical protein